MALYGRGLGELREQLPETAEPKIHGDKDTNMASTDEHQLFRLQIPACFNSIVKAAEQERPSNHAQVRESALDLVTAAVHQEASAGVNANATLYLAATVRCINELSEQQSRETSDLRDALLTELLLIECLALRESSAAVMQLKLKPILASVTQVLESSGNGRDSDDSEARRRQVAKLRSSCSCIASTLAILNASAWTQPEVQKAYRQLLWMAMDERTRVRERARVALLSLLEGPRGVIIAARTAENNADFLASALQSNVDGAAAVRSALQLCDVLAPALTSKAAAQVARALLDIARRRQARTSSEALARLPSVILHREESADADESVLTSSALGARSALDLAQAMSKLPSPRPGEPGAPTAHAAAVAAVATAMASTNDRHGALINSLLENAIQCLDLVYLELGEDVEVASSIEQIVCLADASRDVLDSLWTLLHARNRPILASCVRPIQTFLRLHSMAKSETFRSNLEEWTLRLLKLREQEEDAQARATIDGVFKAMLAGGGAGVLLRVKGLETDDGNDRIKNAWLLDLLRKHGRKTELLLFMEWLVPLERLIRTRATEEEKQNGPVAAKNSGIIADQVYGTLSAFCDQPTDLVTRLNDVTPIIAQGLASPKADMVDAAVRSVRALTRSVQDAEGSHALAQMLNKLLPTLLTLAQRADAAHRAEILQTVTDAVRAAGDTTIANAYVRRALKRVLDGTVAADNTTSVHAFLDISLAFASTGLLDAHSKEMSLLRRTLMPLINNSADGFLQKRAYKALATLMHGGVMEAPPDFVDVLIDAGENVAISSKAVRIQCLQESLEQLDGEALRKATIKVITELVLCTRSVSMKTRASATKAITAVARRMRLQSPPDLDADEVGLRNFLRIVVAGLAGRSSAMLSATLISISRLIREFRVECSLSEGLARDVDALFVTVDDVECNGPGPITLLLAHEDNEVVRAALTYVKAATVVMPADRLARVLPCIIAPLLRVSNDSRKDLRLRVRIIIERLLRKCSREVLEAHFPAEHRRLLTSVRKEHERTQRKKSQRREDARGSQAQSEIVASDEEVLSDEGEHSTLGTITRAGMASTSAGPTSTLKRSRTSGREQTVVTTATGQASQPKARVRLSARQLLASVNSTDHDLLESGLAVSLDDRNTHKRRRRHDDIEELAHPAPDEGYIVAEDGRPVFNEEDSGAEEQNAFDQRQEVETEQAKAESGTSRSLVARRLQQRKGKRQRTASEVGGVTTGEEYRSARAGGDIKRKGKPDPYAYVPLQQSAFSEGPRRAKRLGLLRKVARGSKLQNAKRRRVNT